MKPFNVIVVSMCLALAACDAAVGLPTAEASPLTPVRVLYPEIAEGADDNGRVYDYH